MSRSIAAAFLLALAAPQAAHADCTRANAQNVTVLAMLRHPDDFEGRCVRLKGIVAFRSVFDDMPSLYADLTRRDTTPEPHSVVLYANDEDLGLRLLRARANMDLIGVASTCVALRKRNMEATQQPSTEPLGPGEERVAVMITAGPCHEADGPLIEVAEAIPMGGSAWLTGEAARRKYGDAAFLTSPAKNARKPVDALIAALRARDASLAPKKIAERGSDVTPAMLLDPAKSPYAFLIGAPHAPQIAYFDLSAHADTMERDLVASVCICKRDDCTKDWPIAFGDMDSNEGLPFKCLAVFDDGRLYGM